MISFETHNLLGVLGAFMYISVMVLINIVFISKLTDIIESKTTGKFNEWASFGSVFLWVAMGIALMAVSQ